MKAGFTNSMGGAWVFGLVSWRIYSDGWLATEPQHDDGDLFEVATWLYKISRRTTVTVILRKQNACLPEAKIRFFWSFDAFSNRGLSSLCRRL